MICWGLGAFGLGLTGVLETNTKEDMGAHAELILLWGANLASQPNTGRHLVAARRRGAHVVTIDVRAHRGRRPVGRGAADPARHDAALALAMMHVIVAEGLHDRDFVAQHTVGFDALAAHVRRALAGVGGAEITGIPAERIVGAGPPLRDDAAGHDRARRQLHAQGRQRLAGRARGRLPARAHRQRSASPAAASARATAARRHGQELTDITPHGAPAARPLHPEPDAARHRGAASTAALRAMLLFGTDMLSSFADAGAVARGPGAHRPRRQPRPLPERHRAPLRRRRAARHVLAGGARLQEHQYPSLPDGPRRSPPAGRDAPGGWVLRELAGRLGLGRLLPLGGRRRALLDALLDHPVDRPCHGGGAARRGRHPRALRISHVAHPDLALPHAVRQGRVRLRARGEPRAAAAARLRAAAGLRLIRSRSARDGRSPSSTASTTTAGRCPRWPGSIPSRCSGSRPTDARGARRWRTARPSASSTSAARFSARARVTDQRAGRARSGCATAGRGSTGSPRRRGRAFPTSRWIHSAFPAARPPSTPRVEVAHA